MKQMPEELISFENKYRSLIREAALNVKLKRVTELAFEGYENHPLKTEVPDETAYWFFSSLADAFGTTSLLLSKRARKKILSGDYAWYSMHKDLICLCDRASRNYDELCLYYASRPKRLEWLNSLPQKEAIPL